MGLLDTPANLLSEAGRLLSNPIGPRRISNAIRPHDFAGGFVLTPIIDGQEVPADAVALVGNMMPHAPFAFGGELRKVKEFYAGNSEPIIQVLGSEESDIVLTGRFYSKRYGDQALYKVPMAMTEKLDKMRLSGGLLRFSMGEWVRYGYLTATKWEMKNLGDINYELTITIMSFFKPRRTQLIDTPNRIPFAINNEMIAQATAFQQTFSVAPSSMPQSLADLLNSAINDMASSIAAVTGFVDSVLTEVENVEKSYVRALGTIKHALTSIMQFRRRISGIASNAEITTNTFLPLLTKMSLSQYASNAISGSVSLSLTMEQLRKRFAALSASLPLARHRVQAGDTLQRISTKWYGTPHEWKRIKDHNRLQGTILTEGHVLEVPKL